MGLPFPNLPYLIHGGFKLTESLAIHQYLAEVYDPSLLGKTVEDRAKLEMLQAPIEELNQKTKAVIYGSGNADEIYEIWE